MTDLTQADRRERGIATLTTLQGSQEAGRASAASMEERFGALGAYAVDWLFGDIWSRDRIDPADRALVVISQLTTLGLSDHLARYVGWGLTLGLEPSEIAEVFVQLGGYAGFPRSVTGMTTARQVFAEHGVDEQWLREPAAPKDDAQRRADAREVVGRLNEKQPAGGIDTGMGAFTGTAGRFAFGELWARESLSRRRRSLVVVATLTAQGRADELRFHLGGALNHGATIGELEEVMTTTIAYVGFPTGVEGFRVLREVEAQRADS